jgi:hypothetical protein
VENVVADHLSRMWRVQCQNLIVNFFKTVGWTVACILLTFGSSDAEGFATRCSLSWFFNPLYRLTFPTPRHSVHSVMSAPLLHLWTSFSATNKWIVDSSDGVLAFT